MEKKKKFSISLTTQILIAFNISDHADSDRNSRRYRIRRTDRTLGGES